MVKMEQKFIGREKQKAILEKTLRSNEAEMVAVIGRRRIGKTFLIRSVYEQHIRFELTGRQNTSLKRQLRTFSFYLKEYFGENAPENTPDDWQEAFQQLIVALKKVNTAEKIVLFFDEVPWLSSRKSGFLEGLDFFWNSWAVKYSNIIVVICGSAVSWMIRKVVYHKGGLHNRITRQIRLEPFNLYETELYLKSRQVFLDRYQILQLYCISNIMASAKPMPM
jgi:AAA+ ATPase superfamily predicted ATPase